MKKRDLTRREFLHISALTGVGVLAAACAPSIAPTSPPSTSATAGPTQAADSTSGPRYGGTLRYGFRREGTFSGYPAKMSGVDHLIAYPAIEKLFRLDENLQPAPWLATGLESSYADKTVTISLRKGVKFHDGTDFNAATVKWNLEQHVAAKSAATARVKSVDAIDDSTVRMNLSDWDVTLPLNLAQILGMMISPTAAQKNGVDWAVNNPVGTGPFTFVSWDKGASVKYKKFDGYWQSGKPYLDAIEFVFILDNVTQRLSFEKGELDLISFVSGKTIQELEKAGYVVKRKVMGAGAGGLIPDSGNPKSPWSDLRVRQAASHAIDWAAIGKVAFAGENEVPNQFSFKGQWSYNPDVKGYAFDVAKAKQLMSDAGYANGFKTRLMYSTSTQGGELICTAVQSYFKDIGIDLTLDPTDLAKYNTIYNSKGTWEGLLLSTRTSSVDLLGQMRLRYGGGRNVQMLVPDDFKQAIDNAVSAKDFQTEKKYVWEAQKLMVDTYDLVIFGHNFMDSMISQKYVHDSGGYDVADAAQWTPEAAWMDKAS